MSAARAESTLATGASPTARTLLRDESATNTKARLNNAKFGRAGRIEVSSSRKFENLKHFHPLSAQSTRTQSTRALPRSCRRRPMGPRHVLARMLVPELFLPADRKSVV